MPKEYDALNKLQSDLKNASKPNSNINENNIRSKINALSDTIHRQQIQYLKHYFSVPQQVKYPIAFTQSLIRLPIQYFQQITNALYSNLQIFINNDIWFQILCDNITDNSSFSHFIDWKKAGQPIELNLSCVNFEELQTTFSNDMFSNLSQESINRINKIIDLIIYSKLSQKQQLDLLGISKTTYNTELRNGCSSKISKRLLFALSRATGYSPDYLLNLSDDKNMYFSQVVPITPLPEWYYVINTQQSREKISQKLNELYTLRRDQYNEMKKINNFSDDFLKKVLHNQAEEISVTLINELGRIFNTHPLSLINQIKEWVPYKAESGSTQKNISSTGVAAAGFNKYTFHYFNALDAFNLLEANISSEPFISFCNCLFLLFVFFDSTTRNYILDNFSYMVNVFMSAINLP